MFSFLLFFVPPFLYYAQKIEVSASFEGSTPQRHTNTREEIFQGYGGTRISVSDAFTLEGDQNAIVALTDSGSTSQAVTKSPTSSPAPTSSLAPSSFASSNAPHAIFVMTAIAFTVLHNIF